jgi:hypothetical protein
MGAEITSRSPSRTNDQLVRCWVSSTSCSGYRPRRIGSRKMRFATASTCSAAFQSRAESVAGRTCARFSVTDSRLSAGISARNADTARPWARLRWWAALIADPLSVRPGACTPEA